MAVEPSPTVVCEFVFDIVSIGLERGGASAVGLAHFYVSQGKQPAQLGGYRGELGVSVG